MTEFHFEVDSGRLIIGAGAAALRMEAGAEVTPLHEVLEAKDFPYRTGDFPLLESSTWDRDECLRYGHWVLHVLEPAERPKTAPFTRTHIDRLRVLGLGMNRDRIFTHFKTLANYRTELGLHYGKTAHRYDNWSQQDFADFAASLTKKLGYPPRRSDYRQAFENGDGPGLTIIRKRIGGTRELNDLIGYPNITAWCHDDYLDWGVRALAANPERELTTPLFYVLSKRRRGPSTDRLDAEFGGVVNFREAVNKHKLLLEEKTARTMQEWAKLYDHLARRGVFAENETKLSTDKKAVAAMRYRVAARCLPTAKEETLASIAKRGALITAIRERNDVVSAGAIEMEATSLGIFDFLWPPNNKSRDLAVNDHELARERRRWNDYNRRRAKVKILRRESGRGPTRSSAQLHATPCV
jgi:hypothetical protein